MCLFWQRGAELTDKVRLPRHTPRGVRGGTRQCKVFTKRWAILYNHKKKTTLRRTEVSFGKIHFDILRYFTVVSNASKCIRRRMKADKKKLMKYANAADWAWILEGEIFSVYICCVLMNSEFQPSVLANTWCSWTAKWFQTSERPNVYV